LIDWCGDSQSNLNRYYNDYRIEISSVYITIMCLALLIVLLKNLYVSHIGTC